MSIIPGDLGTEKITGKVDLYMPQDNGRHRKAGTLEVTSKKLPRSQYRDLCEKATDDLEVIRELLIDVKGFVDKDDNPMPYEPDMLDTIFDVGWQFDPIRDFCIAVNTDAVRGALGRKNF